MTILEYPTPDSVPTGITCRSLFIPDDELFVGAVLGALKTLIDPQNWQKMGDLTEQESADAMVSMFDMACFNIGACKMIGEVFIWAGASALDDPRFILCDGRSLLRDDYLDLFTIIGTAYGAPDGSHFRVPDLQTRVPVGQDDSSDVGDTGGEVQHTLTTAEMPTHSHSDTGHLHALNGEFPGLALAPGELPVDVPGAGEFTAPASANITDTGGDNPHNNMQPYIIMNYYIAALS